MSYFQMKENSITKVKMFNWIDNLFEKNKENLVAIRANKIISRKDFRARILCFNLKLLNGSLLKKMFSVILYKRLLSPYFFQKFGRVYKSCRNFLIKGFVSEIIDKPLILPLNTKIGIVYTIVRNYGIFFPENKMYLQYWIHDKRDSSQKIIDNLQRFALLNEKLRNENNVKKSQEEATVYSNLMKMYYCKNTE